MLFKSLKSWVVHRPRLLRIARPLYPPTNIRIFRKNIYSKIDKDEDSKKLMVDIGSGLIFRRHWKNMDYSTFHYFFSNGAIDYEYDMTSKEPFPFNDNSVSFYYTSHSLEHILQKYIPFVFDEVYRTLKAGGVFRISVPDFQLGVEAFLKNDIDFFYFMDGPIEIRFLHYFANYFKGTVSHSELKNNLNSMSIEEFGDYYTNQITDSLVEQYGNHMHVNWYSFSKMERLLKNSGFSNVYRSLPVKSKFLEFQEKSFDKNNPKISLYVEAVK